MPRAWSAGTRERRDHQRQRSMPPQGMFAAFKQASYDAAWKTWDKTADVLRRRAAQLGRRVDQLRNYLQPVTQYTPHHPGNRLAIEQIEREQPDLAKAHAEVLRQQRLEQITAEKTAFAERVAQFEKAEREPAGRVAKERDKIREQRERERGRDDRGRSR